MTVSFPHTYRLTQQRRPALVVAVPVGPGAPDLLWVLMVTSAANRGWPGDVAVPDLKVASLPAPSLIRCAKIATIYALDADRIGQLLPTIGYGLQKHFAKASRWLWPIDSDQATLTIQFSSFKDPAGA